MFVLSLAPIDRKQLLNSLQDERAGALVSFEGIVRNHNQGEEVDSLEYQVYEELAQKEGLRILEEARDKFNLHHIVCQHRYGHLKINDIAVWIGASSSHRDDAFKATRYIIDEIKKRLPIWKKEHYKNREAKWVFCRDHHHHVHFGETEYYQKQMGLIDQANLKAKKVIVIGAGGLGQPALTSLATAGIGQLDFVENDSIEISNIHRQPMFSPNLVGEDKGALIKHKLKEINPFIDIHYHRARLHAGNIKKLILGFDLVIDCSDNLQTKFLLHDTCFHLNLPLISASVYRHEGQIRTFKPQSSNGCWRCHQTQAASDELIGNCNDAGVLGASVATIGSLLAAQAIDYLESGRNASLTHSIFINLKSLEIIKIKNSSKENCACCRGELVPTLLEYEITAQELTQEHELIDVRKLELEQIQPYLQKEKKLVLYCQRGIKSARLTKSLRSQNYHQVYSLAGGVCSL